MDSKEMTRQGRNQSCACGSGWKYKHCCYGSPLPRPLPPEVQQALLRQEADEAIRRRQQGLGKPIIAIDTGEHWMVAVNNRLMWSKTWKTFPDFLQAYIKDRLGRAWGAAERVKSLADRHPILQWWEAYARHQTSMATTPGVINSCEVNGAVQCYLGLAYSLYLMDHNAELQDRMLARLRDQGQFQGAWFEMMVASALIRAGYELVLEDEADRRSRHCEFAAIKTGNGKRYTVEAKSRAVAGLLGRTVRDGGSDRNPLGRLKAHLHDALDKPSAHKRLVFIDINAPVDPDDTDANSTVVMKAMDLLERYQHHPDAPKASAYVFVTNMAFHRHLDERPILIIGPMGYRIPDFNKKALISVIERYRQDRKHQDAYDIARALHAINEFPSTFDGSLPSETLHGEPPRLQIGQTYEVMGPDGPVLGIVHSATVLDATREIYASVETGKGHAIFREMMTETALADWRENKAAYFGTIEDVPKHPKTPYDWYVRFMEMFADYDRADLARQIGKAADDPTVAGLDDEQLREQVAHGLTLSMAQERPAATAGSPLPPELGADRNRRG